MELDEWYWLVGEKGISETKESTYIMMMLSRMPHQIVGFDVAFDKSPKRIQKIVDNVPPAEVYCTDGCFDILMWFIRVNIYEMSEIKVIPIP